MYKRQRLAQEVFEIVGRDLEGLVVRTGNDFEWLRIVDSGLSTSELGPAASSEITNALEVNFFTATPDRYNGQIGGSADNGGDVSLVRYKLVYQDVIDRSGGNTPVYSLYRHRIEPDETFTTLLSQADLGGALPEGDSINDEENLLSENIYDFTLSFNFEFINADGSDGYRRVVMQSGVGLNNTLSVKGNGILVNDADIDLPAGASSLRLASADISVFVISDSGMRGVSRAPINSDADFSRYLNENGTSYTKSVILPQP